MCEPEPKTSSDFEREPPKWLTFVSQAPDDGPWLRMMITNPLNDAMCPLINEPIDIDPIPKVVEAGSTESVAGETVS